MLLRSGEQSESSPGFSGATRGIRPRFLFTFLRRGNEKDSCCVIVEVRRFHTVNIWGAWRSTQSHPALLSNHTLPNLQLLPIAGIQQHWGVPQIEAMRECMMETTMYRIILDAATPILAPIYLADRHVYHRPGQSHGQD